jgi:uncharacterized phage-associated protein
MATAIDTAQYFLAAAKGDGITHLKLETLVSYAQAFSLVLLNRPLFDEDIEAWEYGLIVPSVYHEYNSNGRAHILPKYSEQIARENFDDEQKFVLESVNEYYGVYEAWALRDLSRVEFPGVFGSGGIIRKQDIKEYFIEHDFVIRLKKGYA